VIHLVLPVVGLLGALMRLLDRATHRPRSTPIGTAAASRNSSAGHSSAPGTRPKDPFTGRGSSPGHGKGPYQPTVESTVLAVDEILKPVALTVKSSIAAASKMVSRSPDRARCH